MMTVVVCPTPEGGHIEHALGVAAACATFFRDRTVILSRPGGTAYLGASVPSNVEVKEHFASTSTPKTGAGSIRSLLRLVAENVTAAKFLWRHRRQTGRVVIEEPRFVLAVALRRFLPPMVLFAHNAENHNEMKGDTWTRAQSAFQRYMVRRIPCLAHGEEQRTHLIGQGARKCVAIGLPGDGPFEAHQAASAHPPDELRDFQEHFGLCIGELRPNKGIHLALCAAIDNDLPLVIAGRPLDQTYYDELRTRLPRSNVAFIDRFLSPPEFEWLLTHTAALILPYLNFGAQSGPLARAIQANKVVIANDLPALREQAGGYAKASFVDATDINALGSQMRKALEGEQRGLAPRSAPVDREGWARLASAVDAVLSARQ